MRNRKMTYNSESLFVIINGSLNRDHRLISLFLDRFLKPEIWVVHIIVSLLQLVEIHGHLNHVDAYLISRPIFILFNLILKMLHY